VAEELKDTDLLPHMEKPNPRASHWHDMMLFLRYQVEDYAFSEQKWGSADGLDAEYARREADKKKRNEKKFRTKIVELKKKTRTEAYRKALRTGATGGTFGDVVAGKHEHEWGIPVENANGDSVKTCSGCGMEVEELVF
jgi:DNA-repair protein complementing XP-A cells